MVFGKMEQGQKILSMIEAAGTSSGMPLEKVEVVDCGELQESDVK